VRVEGSDVILRVAPSACIPLAEEGK